MRIGHSCAFCYIGRISQDIILQVEYNVSPQHSLQGFIWPASQSSLQLYLLRVFFVHTSIFLSPEFFHICPRVPRHFQSLDHRHNGAKTGLMDFPEHISQTVLSVFFCLYHSTVCSTDVCTGCFLNPYFSSRFQARRDHDAGRLLGAGKQQWSRQTKASTQRAYKVKVTLIVSER